MAKDKIKSLPIDTSQVKAPRFVCLSALLHAAGMVALVFISATQLNLSKEEIVIELADGPGTISLPPGPLAPESEGVAAASAPLMSETVKTQEAISSPVISSPVVSKSLPIEAPKAAPKSAPVAKSEPLVQSTPIAEKVVTSQPIIVPSKIEATAAQSEVEVPATLEDIEAPSLAEPIATVVPFKEKTPVVEKHALQKLEKAAQAAANNFENELQGDSDLESLGDLENQNAAAAQAMSAHLEGVRAKNAKALADAQAKAAATGGTGLGSQGQGGNATGAAPAGVAGGIRSLEHIRQMPGNPRPAYSETERANNQHGEVVFLAFVNRDGRPVQFKQTKSTGHDNLDQKTLASLKQWKFYPGQEGWVEIPFRWDIRGGPQEMSALNRSKLSQKVD